MMTVYVDQLPDKGWGKWCGGAHMLASDLDELHEVAKKIGLRRSWFQDHSFPHYDLTRRKRQRAIDECGAIEIEIGFIPDDVLMRKPDGTYETHGERKVRYRTRKVRRENMQNLRAREA